ncbi:MAG: efflux RND transporter periplasmic adaptor subunit [Rhodobacterales bacterium]|nr:efflux RND transporter periplasmic adaptor subunit [Rhodobacterales bacterium]
MQTTAHWVLAAMLIGCSGGEGPQGPYGEGKPDGEQEKADPVTVVELDDVRIGEVAQVIASTAAVESESAADLIPSSGGVVVSLHKDEGDTVKKGDLLAVLENVSLDAGAERAGSELRRLEDYYAKLKDLASGGAVSDRELSDAFYQLETARSSAREASHSFGKTRVTSPFDGVVASRNVRVGQLASSGAAAFQVVDLHKLRVVTQMPERDLNLVAVGQPATLTSAYDETRQATGTVQRIAPVIDPTSGTFRVTIEVDPEQEVLRPGQFVTVDL